MATKFFQLFYTKELPVNYIVACPFKATLATIIMLKDLYMFQYIFPYTWPQFYKHFVGVMPELSH